MPLRLHWNAINVHLEPGEKSMALRRDENISEGADFVAYLTSPSASVIRSASMAVDGACAVSLFECSHKCRKDNSI